MRKLDRRLDQRSYFSSIATWIYLWRSYSLNKITGINYAIPADTNTIEKQCKESDRSSNISDLKLDLRTGSSNSNMHCDMDYIPGAESETGSESVITRIGVPLAGPVNVPGQDVYRYSADYSDPTFPPKVRRRPCTRPKLDSFAQFSCFNKTNDIFTFCCQLLCNDKQYCVTNVGFPTFFIFLFLCYIILYHIILYVNKYIFSFLMWRLENALTRVP